MSAAATVAMAESPTFTFVTAQGERHVMESTGLEITFEEGTLVAKNSSQTLSLPVSTLATMAFSDGEVTPTPNPDPDPDQDGINEVLASENFTIYSLDGVEQAKSLKGLRPGIYIVKSNGASHKIVLK